MRWFLHTNLIIGANLQSSRDACEPKAKERRSSRYVVKDDGHQNPAPCGTDTLLRSWSRCVQASNNTRTDSKRRKGCDIQNPLPSPQSRTIEAIMVDAPCVVKVVPLNEEPDNYDDLMAVTFHEGSNESPKILPLIRVKCGTILCVRAPPSTDNASDTSSVDLSNRRWFVC